MSTTGVKKLPIFLFLIIISVSAFTISYLPYYVAEMKSKDNDKFLGQISYTNDQNMYFSFVRQSYNGKWLFNNRLTYLENRNCFFNAQFLIIGKIWKIFNLTENSVYQVWRFLGILILTCSYFLLTSLFFKLLRERIWSLIIYVFAGGFGLFFAILFFKGLIVKHLFYLLTFDLWAGIFPLQQMLTNPHFSLPHGVLLIGIYFYLKAYKLQDSTQEYIIAGIVFAISGLIRPYDLISLFVIIPVFILVEIVAGSNFKSVFKRSIPLLLALPSFVYSVWLFKLDPVFKYWSLQGYNIDFIPLPHIYLFSYGIFFLIFVMRLFKAKSNPLTGLERFMLIAFSSIFVLTHIGHIIPWMGFSPQIAVPLFTFVNILGLQIVFKSSAKIRKILLSTIVVSIIIGSGGIVLYATQKFVRNTGLEYYMSSNDSNGINWLKNNVTGKDVVLSTPQIASRIPKYTDAQVVAGHYSVTPEFNRNELAVRALLCSDTIRGKTIDSLFDNRVSYLYLNKRDTSFVMGSACVFEGMNNVFSNEDVTIYKLEGKM